MRSKNQFTMWKKTLAVIILLVSFMILSIGVLGCSVMIKEGLFMVDVQAYKQNYLEENMRAWGKEILYTYHIEGREAADSLVEGYSIEYFVLDKEYAWNAEEFVKDAEWYEVYTRYPF